jgi:hypothetical protein
VTALLSRGENDSHPQEKIGLKVGIFCHSSHILLDFRLAGRVVDRCEWSASRPGHFTPRKELPVFIVWVTEPVWTGGEETKLCLCRVSKPDRPACSLVTVPPAQPRQIKSNFLSQSFSLFAAHTVSYLWRQVTLRSRC